MATISSRGAVAYVCRACKSRQNPVPAASYPLFQRETYRTNHHTQSVQVPRRTITSKAQPSKSIKTAPSQSRHPINSRTTQPQNPQPAKPAPPTTATSDYPIDSEDVRGTIQEIRLQVNKICASTHLPDQAKVLEVMDKAYQFANVLVFGQTTAPDEEVADADAEGELKAKDMFADLEEPTQTSRKPGSSTSASTNTSSISLSYRERSAHALSETMYTLLKDPKIMITEPILSLYVRIICQLGNPEYLPEIFFLYANKPQPILGSYPIKYRNPSPNSPKNAIPQGLSDVALDTAILQRDLALAVAIIDTTVATRAFRLSKFVKKASLPLAFVGTTPIAAYAAADWVANWQNSLDPQMAKAVTLMGSAAYIGTLTTIGFVAVTTWNDHHERVRWTEGTPLRYRWTREEERLYFDRIAMAWGFQKRRRRGEEMGGMWEELREECGIRGMVLDKSDLLPGMQ